MIILLQIFQRVCQWKNFENPLRINKVIDRAWCTSFLVHSVSGPLNYITRRLLPRRLLWPQTVRQDVCGPWVAKLASCWAACGQSRSDSSCPPTWGPRERRTGLDDAAPAVRSVCAWSHNDWSWHQRTERLSAPVPCLAYSSLSSLCNITRNLQT